MAAGGPHVLGKVSNLTKLNFGPFCFLAGLLNISVRDIEPDRGFGQCCTAVCLT